MANNKSTYLRNKVLNSVFNGAAFPTIGNVYVALFTTILTAAGTGTEVSGGGYARVAKTANTTNFPASTTGTLSNGTEVTFPEATADWGTVKSVGIFDASSGGNLLYFKTITDRPILTGETHFISIGNLDVTEN